MDGIDLGILLANWSIPVGSPGCGGVSPCFSDINCDGVVDGLDLGILLADWSFPENPTCNPDCGGESLQGGGESMLAGSESLQGPGGPSGEELIELLIELGLGEFVEQIQELLGLQ